MKKLLVKLWDFFSYYYYVTRNRYIDYFDYKRLAIGFPIFCISNEAGIIGNKCYGNLFVLKKALGSKFDPKCMIEHGLYFGRYVIEKECNLKNIDTIYTYSEYRVDSIKLHFKGNLNKRIIVLGPYIQYAQNFKSKRELVNIKKNYGKVLLVFPTHLSPEISLDYDYETFVNKIDLVAQKYDTVFISMFWLDIIKGNHLIYERKGYKIVCSGTRSDPFFLSRLKDLIQLADMSMSNDIGTHIGYCICLGTPHYIYKQKIIVKNKKEESMSQIEKLRQLEYKEIVDAFSSIEEKITKKQKKIVVKYWGEYDNCR